MLSALGWMRLTIIGSVILYAAAEALWLRDRRRHYVLRGALWTAAATACAIHAVLAYHAYHGWSHASALRHTAEQTAAVTGLAWSGGLYVNYVFIALWLGDVAWLWASPRSYLARGATLDRAISLWFLFMVVNGAIVFARGPARLVGIAAVVVVVWAWAAGKSHGSPRQTGHRWQNR